LNEGEQNHEKKDQTDLTQTPEFAQSPEYGKESGREGTSQKVLILELLDEEAGQGRARR